MKKLLTAAALLTVAALSHASTNVALGAAVSISGPDFGNSGSWGGSSPAPLSSVVDGVYLPNGTQWNTGTVFWSGAYDADSVTITLAGTASVSSLTLQADNNDDYLVRYLDTADTWHSLTTISPHRSWGMDMGYATLSSPVLAKAFSISAVGGDGYYSVSEFQANGVMAVPEPETYAMLLAGLGVMGAVARRRKAQQA